MKALRDLADFATQPLDQPSDSDCPLDPSTDYTTSRPRPCTTRGSGCKILWEPTPDEMRVMLPPSGYVAGVISRLDRQRGPQHTPANEPVLEVFDVAQSFRESERAVLNEAGVNLVKCFPGQGLLVWGGRTLGTGTGNVFVAHRRLIHRLVRAIRRVAEPLVFDLNGPELWLALVRTITTVLLEAFRAGGLKGARPEEAFFVQCDEHDESSRGDRRGTGRLRDRPGAGRPMEFILLRVALSAEGRLEVFE